MLLKLLVLLDVQEMSSFKEEDMNLNSESYQQQGEENKDMNAAKNQELEQGSATILTAGDNSQENISQETSSSVKSEVEVAEEEDDDWYEESSRKENAISYKEQALVEGEWSPLDVDTTPERETELMQQIQITTEKLENSESFSVFMLQMKSIQGSEEHFLKLTRSEETLRMVIYGVGSFEMYEASRFQLSLALILQRNLEWIGDIEVFDPLLSLTELNVLKKLGLRPLFVNELAKRKVMKPMVFFMPHCPAELYENLLETNWNNEMLNKIMILGNSFAKRCEHYRSGGSGNSVSSITHMLALEPFTKEFKVPRFLVDFSHAFRGTSWHIFNVDKDAVFKGSATILTADDNSQQNISQVMFSSEQDDDEDCSRQTILSSYVKKLWEIAQYKEQEGTTDWSPRTVNTTLEQESDLMQLMENAIEKLEKSEFLRVFMDQLQFIQASEDHFTRLVGSEEKLKVVIYGIGSIESYEQSRLQLSLVINMKKHLDWMGEVEVFDPVISLTELKVIEKLGCSVLSVNEYGRRRAVSPTFFFMPHCVSELYVNLLKTNWRHDLLNRMVLLGDSFKSYDEESRSEATGAALDDLRTRILALQSFTKEYEVSFDPNDLCFHRAFCITSLHLFNVDPNANLQLES
ncbi:protein sensitivity to red light reduced 1 [Tanacetum coccineum]|uniref:Protein sensitivity to red light reduced 1 n=1 Tax=Tanacetum coccineum TaxID=301880 RepID=A0ABQ5ASK1_9ASTR